MRASRYANANLKLKREALESFWEHAGLGTPHIPRFGIKTSDPRIAAARSLIAGNILPGVPVYSPK